MKQSAILFIGNSYTGRNNLPGLIANLASPALITTEAVLANGMSLKYHWDHGHAMAALERQKWDYVVLQEQSTLPLKNRAKTHEYVQLFNGAITTSGARTVLYSSWPRLNALERQDELSEAFDSIGGKIGAIVVPVGMAWHRTRQKHPEVQLYEPDGSHPTFAGSYLAASVFVATLVGSKQLGEWVPEPKLLSPEVAAVLRAESQQMCRTKGPRNDVQLA